MTFRIELNLHGLFPGDPQNAVDQHRWQELTDQESDVETIVALSDSSSGEPKLIFQGHIVRVVYSHICHLFQTHVADFTGTCVVNRCSVNIAVNERF